MRSNIFIIIPSLSSTGPVKGAFALANSLVSVRSVTLVSLKSGSGADAFLDSRVNQICLSGANVGFLKRVKKYRHLLMEAGGKEKVVSISYCFSADMVNLLCRKHSVICSSVRGNLLKIYRMDYGVLGVPVAIFHLVSLVKFDHIVAMSSAMAQQINFFTKTKTKTKVIGNFIDELSIESHRSTAPYEELTTKRFIFVGSISSRKKPILLVRAIKKLHDMGERVTLDMIGSGPLMNDTILEVKRLGLEEIVKLHGHISKPCSLVSRADVFVLPSLAEGTSRAALEALYLGIPCVLRQVDGNSELIQNGINGVLFNRDDELVDALLQAVIISQTTQKSHDNLLPNFFHQQQSANQYLNLVEGN